MNRWDSLPTIYPSPVSLWYREAAAGMTPFNTFRTIDYRNPPIDEPGMIAAGDKVVSAFEDHGWLWGGYWDSIKDYQHFSVSGR